MNNLNLVFLSQVFAECVQMTCSLTIWKADINTGIYIATNGVALLFATYKYQAVNILLSGIFMVIKHSPRVFNQPDNKLAYYQLLFKTHILCA